MTIYGRIKRMDMKKIMELTPDEVMAVAKLQELAKQAKEEAELIYNTYNNFRIGEAKIQVWTDGTNYEYLTYTGIWEARYLHQSYDVVCTPEGIFDILKAKYFASFEDDILDEKAQSASYFEAFISRTKDKKN